jgi:tRNA (cmo5U34)-methyltransferase
MAMDRDEKQLKYWYESGAAGYETRIRNLFSFYDAIHVAINSILRSILAPDSKLLIVGAGTGGEILELGKTNLGWRFLGVDPAQAMLNVASERIRTAGLSDRVSLVKGRVGELPENTVYDAATAAMVLHFVPDDGGKLNLLRDIATRLKPGAPLVLIDVHGDLSAPESKLLCEAWKHQQNLAGVKWEEVERGMTERMKTIHFVSADRVEQLLTEAGFARIQRFFQVFMLGGWIAFKN